MKRLPALGIAALIVAACDDPGRPVRPALTPDATQALPSISDAGHGGNSRFKFLPPLVPAMVSADPFDAGLSPLVTICRLGDAGCEQQQIASFAIGTGEGSEAVRVDASDGTYIVNWHTDQYEIVEGETYRIQVFVRGNKVGHADVLVFEDAKQAQSATTGDYVPLVDGRTLPIKFQMAVGMVAAVDLSAGSATVEVGGTFDLDVSVEDGHGEPVTDRPPVWSSSDESVATVDGNGVVTGVAPGSVVITATADGQHGSAEVTVVPKPALSIAAGANHTCSVIGNVTQCWGRNQYYELGLGRLLEECRAGSGLCVDRPRNALGDQTFVQIVGGTNHTCARTPTGDVYCWGYNGFGQVLADGGSAVGEVTEPTRAAIPEPLTTIASGGQHVCGLTQSGAAYCWGWNQDGQLGDGSTDTFRRPVRVAGNLTFTSITAGERHTCGVSSEGVAYCWGWNYYGQLGDGSTAYSRQTPTRVAGDLRFRTISAGGWHTCAVTSDGRAYCWGDNQYGKLGSEPEGVSQSSPRAVSGNLQFASVSGGDFHTTCGITTDASAYCWGWNAHGTLGIGSEAVPYFSVNPVGVSGGIRFVQVDVGGNHACGLTAAGSRYCWGANYLGQLGTGPNASSPSPALVGTTP